MMTQPDSASRKPRIWAVSGGKGGGGKSYLAAQLAVTQASRGRSVILVDSDPQGAGIHGLLGIEHQKPDIMNFLSEGLPLNECIHRTPYHSMRIVFGNAGTRPLPPLISSKSKSLLNNIRQMDADLVILDLGGGISPEILRLFLSVHAPIVVTVLETPALESFFQFIRALRLYTLNQWLKEEGFPEQAAEVWEERPKNDVIDFADLKHYLPGVLGLRRDVAQRWPTTPDIHLVLNHLTSIDEVQHGFSLRTLCRKHLDLQLKYSGYVEHEAKTWKKLSAVQGRPRMNITPRIRQEILRIGDNLLHAKEISIGSG